MKNSKNKILAAVICGVVAGSVGTSLIGNFQKGSSNTALSDSHVSSYEDYSDDVNSIHNDHTGRGENGDGKGRHKGAAIENTQSVDIASGTYADGVYEGTASGYSNNLKVQVEISGGKIADINIVSHNETPGFCEKAFEQVPARIIEKQSTDVDTVSGATYSSIGIINAVNNALNG